MRLSEIESVDKLLVKEVKLLKLVCSQYVKGLRPIEDVLVQSEHVATVAQGKDRR